MGGDSAAMGGLTATHVDDPGRARGHSISKRQAFPGACLLARFASLFGRINSLFASLGNFHAQARKINGLAVSKSLPSGLRPRFSHYLPVEQRNQRGVPMSRRQNPSGQSIRSTAA